LKKTRGIAVSGDRIVPPSRGTGVKKYAFRNTAKEHTISSCIGRILPIPVDFQRLFLAVDIPGCVPCSPKFLKGERSPLRAWFDHMGDDVPKRGDVPASVPE
jgi:hypothetical protein